MIKYGDLPASPVIGEGGRFVSFLDGIKGGRDYGLTKREMFAKQKETTNE